MSTCGFLKYISLLILVNVGQIPRTGSAPVLATNRRVPVEGVSFSITCTLDAAITSTVRFYKGASVQGGCTSSGSCSSPVSGYSVSLDSTSRILTLDIASPESTRDSGTWSCTVGTTVSDNITLSHVAAVLDWSSVTFSPQLTSLPSSVTPQNTISVTVTTPCAAPAAVITWRYQQGVSGVPPSSTSSSQGSCPSEQVQTTNTLSLPGNTASLYNRQVSLTVSVEHDSFDPPTYTTSVTSNTIQFPVPVTSVTLTNINSDNEEIGQAASQSLTLTCVTSASFPTSTVTWVTLPSGTTPTVSTETTSGVLVKTTSSVTFTVSRSDQGRSIHCQAENINGQTSPQSNRATLEVWYGPDTNQVRVTKPANTVVAEDRDLTLTCETLASVSPGVTFTWDYSDGSGITGGSTGSVTGSAGTTWSQTRTFRPVRSKTDVRCSVRNTRTAVAATKTLSLGDVKYPPPGRPTLQDFPSVMYAGVQKTIRCSVTGGNPLADITWSCYNISNTGSESSREGTKTSSLTFLVTKHQNSRQCQCGASWMYGGYDETVTQTFTVYYPPDKPTTTNPGTLCEGKSTSLTCSSSPDPGNPPATFYWTKDNAAVHTGTSYTFSPFKTDNGADVRCAAGNTYTDRAGSSRPQSDARQLSVYYVGVPTITPAATQTRKEGQSLSLTCSADSNPDNAVISWTFNDSPIPGSSVMKADLNRSDDGEYGCTGRVNTGSVCPGGSLQGRSTVRVIVNYPAEVVLDTQGSATCRPHRVYVGQQNVQLTCMVTAANPAVTSYTWTHNSSVIQSARGAVFSINSVSRTSGGSYTCQGNNSLGGSTSSPVTLEVQYPPSVSVLSSQTVIETQTLTVTCSVDSKPAAAVAWTRTNSSSFTPLSGSTLIISNIQRSQAGTYVCTATNTLSPCGGTTLPRSESREMTVDVQYPATVSMFTANSLSGLVTVNESDPVALRCQVDSNPGPIIRLLNGTEELTRTDNFLASEYRLESADCRQRGNYSCTATNNIGAPVSQRIELMVKCSPRLDETMPQQLEYTSRLGGNVDVSVSVLAYPLPTFTWSRTTSTSQDLTGSSSPVSDISVTARLHLTYLQQQDFGDYRLTVDNGVDRRLFYTVRIVPEDSPDSGAARTGPIAWTATGTEKLPFTHCRDSNDAIIQKNVISVTNQQLCFLFDKTATQPCSRY